MASLKIVGFLITIAGLLLHGIAAVSLPSCQAVAPEQTVLNNVHTALTPVPGAPFGLAYALHKDIAFVTLDSNNSALGVLNASTFPPSLIHQIPLLGAFPKPVTAFGLALTHDGRHLVLAAGPGIILVNVGRAINGSADAIVGALNGTVGDQLPGSAAIEVTLSSDDRYAFVSQEYGSSARTPGNIDVFKLHKPSANGSVTGTAVGYLDLGYAVVGTSLSPNGKTLYAVSETTTLNDSTPGILSTIDVKKLERHPSQALLSNATGGCGMVRTLVSSNGEIVWTTARESNFLLAYNASKLVSEPSNALIAAIQVGTAPVGLTFALNETRILTADSNRFRRANATSGISVVDIAAALAGSSQAVLGRIPTGLFPREFAVSSNGRTILVADYTSGQIQAIDASTLP